jgi:hypothetical protein
MNEPVQWALYEGLISPQVAVRMRDGIHELARTFPAEMMSRMRWAFCDEWRTDLLFHSLLLNVQHTDIVIWRDDLRRAAEQGCEVFSAVPVADDLAPALPQLWLRQRAGGELLQNVATTRQLFELPEDCQLEQRWVAPSLGVGEDGKATGRIGLTLGFTFYALAPESPLPYLRFFPPLYPGDLPVGPMLPLIAGLEFMRQEIVVREPSPLPRQQRRWLERKDKPVPNISTVTLRRRTNGQSPATTPESIPAEWSCQWLVRGHWRQQYHPSNGERRPKFIAPYLKGPDDKPLKTPAERVFMVKR